YKEWIAGSYFKLTCRSHTFRNAFGHLFHSLVSYFSPFLVESTESPLQLNLVWNYVGSAFGYNLSERKYCRHLRVCNSAYNLLKSCNDMCSNYNWVNILLRLRGVTTLSNNAHIKLIRGSHIFSRTEAY